MYFHGGKTIFHFNVFFDKMFWQGCVEQLQYRTVDPESLKKSRCYCEISKQYLTLLFFSFTTVTTNKLLSAINIVKFRNLHLVLFLLSLFSYTWPCCLK